MPGSPLFDRYIFVDWSASARPVRGKDSIWFAVATVDRLFPPRNPRTRDEATHELRRQLVRATGRGERVLIGFDFPFGYPAGFAAALGHSAASSWRATWSTLRARVPDCATNANRRFEDAAELNRELGSPPGPFWGHPPGFTDAALTWNVSFPFTAKGGQRLRELRHTERHLRAAKRTAFPVWKLAGQGAAGSQALLGIPRVAALRDDPALASVSLVWPFETGFSIEDLPDRGPFVVHAEVWPGVLDPNPGAYAVRDAGQVLALVRWARGLDRAGRLAREFGAPPGLSAFEIDECIAEEGWILGATTAAPRSRRI